MVDSVRGLWFLSQLFPIAVNMQISTLLLYLLFDYEPFSKFYWNCDRLHKMSVCLLDKFVAPSLKSIFLIYRFFSRWWRNDIIKWPIFFLFCYDMRYDWIYVTYGFNF